LAARLRAGRIYLNAAPTLDTPAERHAPFGGYKHSGNGRQQGVFGLEEYLEVKAILGDQA
jgi:aldehyde dehydrogenase (NAD+)